ncbi:Chemotaxis protein [Candidatus Methylobacter favarea]|uniref:Chemotaxis protein n=1 Tax=Candidatus Methylobacter favarea TaxID=2707345 RepID=A0A8S0Y9Z0_9GAMM|nr:chemotaxis protein CheW [Candidatus Methylobacter favarea]CAA9890861.1 Chemotaxis protein [Candidatus Methylobacter favarea]
MKRKESMAVKKKTTGIDWQEIGQRMKAARAAIEHDWSPSPDESRQILKTRAQQLAQEPMPADNAGERIEVVEFRLAYEHYAVESRYVREVCPLENLTPLPCTPAFVLGIVNVRGEIVSVIDLKKFFALPEKGLTDLNKIIVLQSDAMVFGILANAICGVRSLALSALQGSLPTFSGLRETYLKGVMSKEGIVILDAGKLLTDEKIIVREQVDGATADGCKS